MTRKTIRNYAWWIVLLLVLLIGLIKINSNVSKGIAVERVAREEMKERLDRMEERAKLHRVYTNDLWRRMVEAGTPAPPPPWAEEQETEDNARR